MPCLRPSQHPQLRVGRRLRPTRGREWTQQFWRKFKWILNCLIMHQSQTRPKCDILSQKSKNLTCVTHQKCWVSPRCRKKILQRGRKVTKHGTARIGQRCWVLPSSFSAHGLLGHSKQAKFFLTGPAFTGAAVGTGVQSTEAMFSHKLCTPVTCVAACTTHF